MYSISTVYSISTRSYCNTWYWCYHGMFLIVQYHMGRTHVALTPARGPSTRVRTYACGVFQRVASSYTVRTKNSTNWYGNSSSVVNVRKRIVIDTSRGVHVWCEEGGRSESVGVCCPAAFAPSLNWLPYVLPKHTRGSRCTCVLPFPIGK